MFRTLVIAAGLAVSAVAVAVPALADAYCGPDFYYSRHWGECRPYAYRESTGVIGGAGYVAGSAIGAAGNVAGAAIGTAGAIVNGVLGR
jgi:hypothetical protein